MKQTTCKFCGGLFWTDSFHADTTEGTSCDNCCKEGFRDYSLQGIPDYTFNDADGRKWQKIGSMIIDP